MIAAVALAVALAAGVDARRIAMLAGVVYLPYAMAVLLALVAWRSRPGEDSRPSLFCAGVASELRAGASLRSALTTAAGSVGERLSADSSLTELAAQVGERFPTIGLELRLTIVSAGRVGSDSAALFDEIGSLALAQAEIKREVRTATAPGRATALVLIGAPMLYVGSRLSSGELGRLFVSPQQRFVALLGLGLFGIGLTLVALIVWRAAK
ncbi:MAG: hypothetical protein PVF87_07685 [Acidimicrobiia bacterium]|jgi:hypothetical protein